jgi:hypothetical protein
MGRGCRLLAKTETEPGLLTRRKATCNGARNHEPELGASLEMRAASLALAFAIAFGPAIAGDRTPVPRPRPAQAAPIPYNPAFQPALRIRIAPLVPHRNADLPLRLGSDTRWNENPIGGSSVSIGPLQARLGGTAQKAHLARYKLEDVDVLGGSVSGTFDGRGARLYVRWPPSDED